VLAGADAVRGGEERRGNERGHYDGGDDETRSRNEEAAGRSGPC